MLESKICTKCGVKKSLDCFNKKLDRLTSRCKECIKQYQKSIIKITYELDLSAIKECSRCHQKKNGSEFIKNQYMPYGLDRYCKLCSRKKQSIRRHGGKLPVVRCVDCDGVIDGVNTQTLRCLSCKKQKVNLYHKKYYEKKIIEDPMFCKRRYAKYGEKQNKRRSEKYHTDQKFREKKQKYNLTKTKEGYFRDWHSKNKEKENERCIRWRRANIEKANQTAKIWRDNNKEKIRLKDKAYIEKLTDSRVALLIRGNKFKGIKLSFIPKDIIEQKRLSIQIKRELKKLKDNGTNI